MNKYTLPALEKMGIRPGARHGLPVYHIENPYAEAEISPYGAHVLSYTPKGEKDLLWLSEKSWFEEGKPIRGGIPVCWPWFSDAGTPKHGIARIAMWEMETARVEADMSTTLIFSLDRQAFCGLTARLLVNVGPALSLALRTKNHSTSSRTLSEALHTYFAVKDITKVSILGLEQDDLPESEKLFPNFRKGRLTFRQETDLVCYPDEKTLVIDDQGAGRKIRVERAGSATAVVWNPWIAKSKAMPDFGDDEYKTMVCVEAANARDGVVGIIPGSAHTLRTRISLI